jgi:hypothetical protein
MEKQETDFLCGAGGVLAELKGKIAVKAKNNSLVTFAILSSLN